jgi:hypothetical protein
MDSPITNQDEIEPHYTLFLSKDRGDVLVASDDFTQLACFLDVFTGHWKPLHAFGLN